MSILEQYWCVKWLNSSYIELIGKGLVDRVGKRLVDMKALSVKQCNLGWLGRVVDVNEMWKI